MSSLWIKNVSFAYLDGLVLQDIELSIGAGEKVGLLGPNGSGKTTLLKVASGVLRPGRGEVLLGGIALSRLSRRQIAQMVAVVPQQFQIPFAFAVEEVVLLGRTPFLRPLAGESEGDRHATQKAMRLTGIEHLARRIFNELSGGERQRVIMAMALAQEPKLLLLDEPTANLDINHRVEILELVSRLNREQGLTVVAAMHDLNLASLYFDRLVVLKGGTIFADGPPRTVLTCELVRQVFGASVWVGPHPVAGVPHVALLRRDGSQEQT